MSMKGLSNLVGKRRKSGQSEVVRGRTNEAGKEKEGRGREWMLSATSPPSVLRPRSVVSDRALRRPASEQSHPLIVTHVV